MRALLPYLSVLLAIVASGSIAYIAWDLTSETPPHNQDDEPDDGAAIEPQHGADAPGERDG